MTSQCSGGTVAVAEQHHYFFCPVQRQNIKINSKILFGLAKESFFFSSFFQNLQPMVLPIQHYPTLIQKFFLMSSIPSSNDICLSPKVPKRTPLRLAPPAVEVLGPEKACRVKNTSWQNYASINVIVSELYPFFSLKGFIMCTFL